jgi:hypothetical protein
LARDCPWERGTFPTPFFSTEFTVAVFWKIFYVVYIHGILFSQRCCCVSFCLLGSCQFSIWYSLLHLFFVFHLVQ